MATAVANTSNTNTFEYWLNRTNDLAYRMSTSVITTDNSGSNSFVSGNAVVNGVFTANGFTFGNASVNTTVYSPNSSQKSSGEYFLNANGSWSLLKGPSVVGNATTNSVSANVIDFYAFSDYKVVEYIVSIKDDNANSYVATKLLTAHDGGVAYITEYGTIVSNASLGTFAASANVTHVQLVFTPSVTNATINYIRLNI